MLAEKLNKKFIDIDEFIIQETGKDAADHLEQLGDEKFLEFEASVVKKINISDAIISSSGSVPLKKDGIDHLKKNSITVWMDIPLEIIEQRVGARHDGDSRIVGASSMTLEEIFAWRKKSYQENHDFRFYITQEAEKEKNLEKLFSFLKENDLC